MSSVSMKESLVLLLACCLVVCTAIDTITISSPIKDAETIVSSGQTFMLGFFSPANNSNRYVGIMYNNIPETITIWVANRDKPIKDSGGILAISEDGNLVILNGEKEVLWSSNVTKSVKNSSARLLDTGNLVLTDNSDGRIMWESFQIPTDSLVPKMRLSTGAKEEIQLTSWRSPSDPSVGSFSVGLNLFRSPQFFVWKNNEPYWRSGPWNGNTFIGIPGMNYAYQSRLNLMEVAGSTYFTYNFVNNPALFYYTLNTLGSLQAKVAIGKGDWNVTWSNLKSQCDVYGKCGPFWSCDPRRSPVCACLRDFKPRDEKEWNRGNWTGGCIRKEFLLCQRYQSSSLVAKGDGFVRLPNMKVPDFTELLDFSEEGYGNSCLENCSCIAYAYYNVIGCMHWSGNLIDVQQFSFDGTDLYVRVPYTELDKKKDTKAVIAPIVVVASLFIAVSAYLL